MSLHNLRFFDFEVYPEWWCCVISDEEDEYPGGLFDNKFDSQIEKRIKDKMRVYTSDMDPEFVRSELRKEFLHGISCGYNIKRFDMKIAKCVLAGFTPRKLYIASEILIDDNKTGVANKNAEYQRVASFINFGFNEGEGYQDLLDDSDKSLKDKECSLGMDIRETTVPFGKVDLTQAEKDEIIFYCKHDVFALHVVYWCVAQGYVSTKIDLCKTFGLPMKTGYVNTNANLCGKVLEATRVHGTTISDPTITIREPRLKAYFEKWVPKECLNHLLTKVESRTFYMYENEVTVADGGLHSVFFLKEVREGTKKYKPGLYVESTDEWTMYNVDASSCYASVMMYCDAMSRAIKNPKRLKEIYLRRIKLKMTPKSQWTKDDKAFVAAAKLILNTTYGAMGNKWLALYDDYMRSKTCRVGQMILIAIGNQLFTEIPGLRVIQDNTDGILVYARRSDLPKIQAIVDEFSAISQFIFEVEEDNRLWQLNVNNYVAVHPDGEVKNKGGSFVMSVYQPGYNKCRPLGNFCIPRAQIAFYTKKENPIKHLLANSDVSDFCLTCTKGPGYKKLIQHNKMGDVELGRVSRVIAVTNPEFGTIVKTKTYTEKTATKNHPAGSHKEDTVALCPTHPLVINDALYNYYIKDRKLHHVDGRSWDIDYAYYARELDKALDVYWCQLKNEKLTRTKEYNL